jgi:hypothetical protein
MPPLLVPKTRKLDKVFSIINISLAKAINIILVIYKGEAMKKSLACLLIIIIISFLIACKETKEESDKEAPPEGETVMDVTFKGDDMARALGLLWTGSVENDGSKGATIDTFVNFPDTRELKTVVLFVGIHNFGKNKETAQVAIPKFVKLYGSLNADKIICVSVPPVYGDDPYDSQLWTEIWEFNQAVKIVCGDNYIETWEITYTSDDGIYPDQDMNNLIKAKVTALMGTTAANVQSESDL